MKHLRSTATILTSALFSASALAQPAPTPPPAEAPPATPPAQAAPAPAPAATPAAEAPSADAPATAEGSAEASAEPATGGLGIRGAVEEPAVAEEPAPVAEDAAVEDAAVEDAAEDKPALPSKLAIGKAGQGLFQPSMLLQFWTLYQHADEDSLTFRVRRAEFKAKGDIIPGLLSYSVMLDPSKALLGKSDDVDVVDDMGNVVGQAEVPAGDHSVLQDFGLTFKSDYADVTLGQFKVPVSYEGSNSSSKLMFPERVAVAKEFGDKRDIGIKAEKKLGDIFYYNVGVYNGSGLNKLDDDNDKDLALRLEVYPIEGLMVGAVGYTTVGERDSFRDRIEGDLRYDAHNLLFQAEYIRGWTGSGGGPATEGHGAYGALGYSIGDFQPVVRVGMLDKDLDTDDDGAMQYDFGLNYYIQSQEARVSLAGTVTAPEASDADNTTDVILAFQASF